MPIKIHFDNYNNSYYYQYGNQKKYYFDISSERSQKMAYNKCLKQAKAIHSSQNKSSFFYW